MATTALKMAAICSMLLLVLTMGQLMTVAYAGASAPLVQSDAAPTARRLLSAADHEEEGNCPCLPWTPQCCFRGFHQKKTGDDDCPCLPWTPQCCFRGLQKKKTAGDDCPCTFWTPQCCHGLQKAAENCPCIPGVTPWCCFGAGSAATN